MHFNVRVLTVSQLEYAEPELKKSFEVIADSYQDAEEGAIMQLEMLAKHQNGDLWGDDKIIITIMPKDFKSIP